MQTEIRKKNFVKVSSYDPEVNKTFEKVCKHLDKSQVRYKTYLAKNQASIYLHVITLPPVHIRISNHAIGKVPEGRRVISISPTEYTIEEALWLVRNPMLAPRYRNSRGKN